MPQATLQLHFPFQEQVATHTDFLPQADGGQDAPHSLSTPDLPDQGLSWLVFKGPVPRLELVPNRPVENPAQV
jgi:hypothetical protein